MENDIIMIGIYKYLSRAQDSMVSITSKKKHTGSCYLVMLNFYQKVHNFY